MIYTSNYDNCINYNDKEKLISISGDRGKSANFSGRAFKDLSPKKDFYYNWKNNIFKLSKVENDRYYIKNYIIEVLSNLDSRSIYDYLNNKILLCYEDSKMFCHRHIVAYWFIDELGVEIPEISFDDGKMVYLERPEYIKELYEEEKHLLKKYR